MSEFISFKDLTVSKAQIKSIQKLDVKVGSWCYDAVLRINMIDGTGLAQHYGIRDEYTHENYHTKEQRNEDYNKIMKELDSKEI